MTTASTDNAAADRIIEAADRLARVRSRLERLQRGEPCTPEDVATARKLAVAQEASLATARERLLRTHRSSVERLRRQLERGRTGRPLHVAETAAAERDAPASPTVPASSETEMRRLRSAVVASLSSGSRCDVDDTGVRAVWPERLVQQSRAADWQGWARAICAILANDFPRVRGAAISVVGDEGAELVAASDPTTSRLQELELMVGEGPSTTAQQTASAVIVDDFAAERTRWQGYASATFDRDIRSITALPLCAEGAQAGVLTIYGRSAAPGGPVEQRAAAVFARMAVTALLFDWHEAGPDAVEDSEWFRFYVAIGAIAARFGVGVEEADARLRAHAFSTGLTLAQVTELALTDRLDLD